MRGIPHYCVSLACMKDGRLEHAVIVDPVRREEFIASRGRGAQVNGHRMRVTKATELRESLLGTGIPFLGHEQDKLPAYAETMSITRRAVHRYPPRWGCSTGPRVRCRWSSRRVLGDWTQALGYRSRCLY